MADEQIPPVPQSPEDNVQQAPGAESIVNVINPQGKLVGLPATDAQQALTDPTSGYKPVTEQDAAHFENEEKNAGVGGAIKAGLQGAGDILSFGALPWFQRHQGMTTEDILGPGEAHPLARGVGQGIGLGLSHITGLGELEDLGNLGNVSKVLSGAGEGASKLLGLTGEGAVQKIGSAAVKSAVDNALFQGIDETSKAMAGDPNQSAQTALVNMGISGLIGAPIGAAFGAISPLWKATSGTKIGQILNSFSERLGGVEGASAHPLDQTIAKAGIEMKPELKATLTGPDWLTEEARTLSQSDTTRSGLNYQKSFQDFEHQAGEKLISDLGRTPEQIEKLKDFSQADLGTRVQKTLADEAKAQVEPASKIYEEVQNKYKHIDVPESIKTDIENKIGQAAVDNGWNIVESAEGNLSKKIIGGLKNVKTLNDLKLMQSNLGAMAQREQLWHAGKTIKNIFQDARTALVTERLTEEAPELLDKHFQADQIYKAAMNSFDDLNARLKVGKYSGPTSFLHNLSEMTPETVVNRLAKQNDAQLLSLLSEKFPQTAEAIKNFHIDSALKEAAEKAMPGKDLSITRLLTSIQSMTPEMKQFALPPGAAEKIEAVDTLLEGLKNPKHNFSNTGRVLDKLKEWLPSSAVASIGYLTGHGAAGLLVGPLVKYLGKDVPDAIRLGLLKMMGSSEPISAGGFKTMVDFIHHMTRGESALTKSVKSFFNTTKMVAPSIYFNSHKEIQKLDDHLKELQKDPSALTNVGGSLGHYLPEHATALAATAASSVNYLNALRPSTMGSSPLDREKKPSKTAEASFHNALQIAENPLVVLDKMNKGTLNSQDLSHLHQLAPALYEKMKSKMMDELIAAKSKGVELPYSKRLSLSLFLGQPLDSTMTPQAIRSTQPLQQMQPGPQPMVHPRHSMTGIAKLSDQAQTPMQARESSRASQH